MITRVSGVIRPAGFSDLSAHTARITIRPELTALNPLDPLLVEVEQGRDVQEVGNNMNEPPWVRR